MRGQSAATVSPRIVCNNAVLEHHRAPLHVKDTAAPALACSIPTECAVIDHERSSRLEQSAIQDATSLAARTAAVPAESTVSNDKGAVAGDAAAPVLARNIAAEGALDNGQKAAVADGAADFCAIPADGGID